MTRLLLVPLLVDLSVVVAAGVEVVVEVVVNSWQLLSLIIRVYWSP